MALRHRKRQKTGLFHTVLVQSLRSSSDILHLAHIVIIIDVIHTLEHSLKRVSDGDLMQRYHTLPKNLSFLKPRRVGDLIRCGRNGDGGYVFPLFILDQVDAIVSFGLGTDFSFETCVHYKKPGLTVHAYDNSVDSKVLLSWCLVGLVKLIIGHSSIEEFKARIFVYKQYQNLFKQNNTHFHERVFNRIDRSEDVTIDTVMARLPNSSCLMVKIDIEGTEYRIIPHMKDYFDKIALLIIEFHDTSILRHLFEKCVKGIQESFEIVHLHANNCSGVAPDGLPDILEITFLHKRFSITHELQNSLPLKGLDFPNDPMKPDIILHFE